MEEITLLDNKSKRELFKYIYIGLIAVITWVLQVAVFSKFAFHDNIPNVILLLNIFMGLTLGPLAGIFCGTISSFFSASILYDHTFYLSYPLVGLISGLLKKNVFSDEFLFFLFLSILFTFFSEFLNGFQYGVKNIVDFKNAFISIGLNVMLMNILIAPFLFIILNTVNKKIIR